MGPDRLRRPVLLILGLSLALVALVGAGVAGAYVLDTWDGPRTVRGLQVADRPAGDLTPEELDRALGRLRNEIGGWPVSIRLPERNHRLRAAELGISLDRSALKTAALSAGRGETTWERFRNWLGSFTATRRLPLRLQLDRGRATEAIGRLDGLVLEEPTEPRLVMSPEQQLIVREGADGTIVDVEDIVDRLEEQVAEGEPSTVEARTRPLPPSIEENRLAEVAEEVNVLTAEGVNVQVEDEVRTLGASALRVRLDIEPNGDEPRPTFDLDSLQNLIEHTFRDVELGGEDPVFDVVDDEPVLVEPGTPPMECCSEDAAQVVAAAVLEGRDGPVRIEPQRSEDPRLVEWAEGQGVVEKVSEFTTNHSCCQGRVDNIQRFADIVRGAYLLPGESLSLNGHVGERTREKGFVPAGTIIRGHLVPTVGGGVSQFATTMFNAAFFAGFDFITYQSHSIYFSRYPYGREATISWPAPDLEFANTTDYPALIWTSYTDTSITVSIYSTKSVEVEEIGQETSPARACTRVDTYRRRTYEDGTEVEDSVFATYRPSEGIDCNGNPTDRPNL